MSNAIRDMVRATKAATKTLPPRQLVPHGLPDRHLPPRHLPDTRA